MVRLDVEGEDPHVVSGLGEGDHTDAIAATYLLLALDEAFVKRLELHAFTTLKLGHPLVERRSGRLGFLELSVSAPWPLEGLRHDPEHL